MVPRSKQRTVTGSSGICWHRATGELERGQGDPIQLQARAADIEYTATE